MHLFQFCNRFLDSSHGFADVFVACGVTHAEAIGVAKGISAYGGHMAYFKEIHREVGGVLDGVLAVALAVEAAAFGEEVEGTLGHIHFQSGNILG